jgi:hypothetical protein
MPKAYAALASLLVLVSGIARAEEGSGPLELTWTAPAECPQMPDVYAEVLRLIGGKARGTSRLAAQGTVVLDDDGRWSVVLETRIDGAEGSRSIAGPTCQAVSDAAALTLALTLDPDLRLPEAAPELPGSTSKAAGAGAGPVGSMPPHRPAKGSAPPAPTRRAPYSNRVTVLGGSVAAVRRPRTVWLARAFAGGNLGALPELGSEFGLGLGVGRGSALGWLIGAYSPPQDVGTPARQGLATVWVGSLAALGCYRLSVDRAELDPCGGLQLARASGRGTDRIITPDSDSLFWLSPALGASIGYRLSHAVRLSLDGFGLVALERPEGRIDGVGRVYKPGRVAGSGFIGVEVRIR